MRWTSCRIVTALAVTPALLASAGCLPVPRVDVTVTTSARAPIRIGVLPSEEEDQVRQKHVPLVEYLGRGLGQPVEIEVSPTYDSLGTLLGQGKVEMACFSGISYARMASRHGLVPEVRVGRRGKTTYRGTILVRSDSPIRTVAGLRGKRFAYVDRDSGSGFLAANAILVAAGLDPLRDLGRIEFTHGHRASLEGLKVGRYDAAAVFEGAADVLGGELGPSTFREFARSGPMDSDVIVLSRYISPALRAAIRDMLLSITSVPEGQRCLRAMQTYDPVERFVPVLR